MINTGEANLYMHEYTEHITQWHYDRNLIVGSARPQVVKLLEEFTEVVAAITQAKSAEGVYDEVVSMLDELLQKKRLKPVIAGESRAAYKDALGDMYVVMVNLVEKDKITMEDCVAGAWEEIKDRKGKMVDGIFIKEADFDLLQEQRKRDLLP